jgi:NADH-quinone oxidoreductase subunit H
MQAVVNFLLRYWVQLVDALVIVAIFPLLAGYVVLMERKLMADMQARLGPMRVGPHGLLQPLADAVKLMIKEDIIPEQADRMIFWLAPILSVTAAMLAFAAIAVGPGFLIADMNIGLLFILAISSMGIFGIVLGGWASNSHYSLLGALRSSAQLVSYEVAVGMAMVAGLLLAGTLSMKDIVLAQADRGVWFVFVAPIGFVIYLIGSVAETNRAPFDMPEAESELVAGYMTEYSGFRWALYFLAEYANMVVVGSVATTLFLGGWLRPFPSVAWLNFLDFVPPLVMLGVTGYCFYRVPRQTGKDQSFIMLIFAGICLLITIPLALVLAPMPQLAALKPGIHGAFWFIAKVLAYVYVFLWVRFTFPRYRFDQLMRLGWHHLIPLSIVNVMGVATAMLLRENGVNPYLAFGATIVATILVAMWLVRAGQRREQIRAAESEGAA